MKISIAVLVGLLMAGGASASEKMVKDLGCMSCHNMERKVVGPSFKQIAERYHAVETVDAHLFIMNGSLRRWGPVPMPVQPKVTEDQAKAIVKWILTLK